MRTILCTLGVSAAVAFLGGCTESDHDPVPAASAAAPAPLLSGVTPASGDVAGGLTITVDGSNFVSGATVSVGGTPATSVAFVSATRLTALTPSGAQGAATVVVTNPDSATATLTGGFTYTSGGTGPNPTLATVSPNAGPLAGGQAFTLSGSGYQTGATVTVGGTAATSIVVVSGATITAVTPVGAAGPADVVVTNLDATSVTLTGGYTYANVPTVSSVTPNTGDVLGGTAVTIAGTNFATGATVRFGSTTATGVVVTSAAQITAVVPAGAAGAVTVTVTNPNTLNGALAAAYTYTTGGTQPSISNVSLATGPWAGGTPMTLTGSNFVSGATVTVGGVAAVGTTFFTSSELRCTSPAAAPGTAGVQPVTVTNPGGAGATNTSPGFTYTTVPVESVSDPAADPDVAIDGAGNIHVVWQRTTSTPSTDILYVRSTDNGLTWTSTPINLDGTGNAVSRPRIAARGNNVMVVWNETTTTQDVRRTESTDNGVTWSTATSIATGSITADPDVAILGSGIYVVAYLVNGGPGPQGATYRHIYSIRGAFAGPYASPVAVQTSGMACGTPSLAVSGTNDLWITYDQQTYFGPSLPTNGDLDIGLVRSTDGGVSYATPQVIANDSSRHYSPTIVASGSTVVVARAVTTTTFQPAGYVTSWQYSTLRSTDGGLTFSNGPVLASGSGAMVSTFGSALDGNGVLAITWIDTNDTFTSRSTDQGVSFTTAVNLSANNAAASPQVAGGAGSTMVHVWADASSGTADVVAR